MHSLFDHDPKSSETARPLVAPSQPPGGWEGTFNIRLLTFDSVGGRRIVHLASWIRAGGREYHLPMATTKLGILISGRGSNMMSIVAACDAGTIPAEVALVVSNTSDAAGLGWANEHGLATVVHSHRDFSDREDHDRAIVRELKDTEVEWVCLAGYMRLLSRSFIEAFPNRILNIHPSLLPSFPGLHGQRDALRWGVRVSGCTVHLVDLELDHGPIVEQRAVAVRDDDDSESLSDRILEHEHEAYPEAIRKLLTLEWSLDGRRIVFGSARS